MISMDSALVFVVVIAAVIFIGSYAKILREYERGVIFRLGRNARALLNPGGTGNGPGLVLLAPFIDRMVKVSMQTVALDVPAQDGISRDNVSLKVSAVIYFRVIDPIKAVIAVQDYLYATSQIAQTTLRSVLGQVELDDLLSARDKINQQLQRIIDEHTEPWGIKVANVEVKQIDLPQDMQRARIACKIGRLSPRGVGSVGRAGRPQRGGRGFESLPLPHLFSPALIGT